MRSHSQETRMARPFVPDVDKRKTVPLRLTKPQYRALSAIASITGDTIQEQLREATKLYLEHRRDQFSRRDNIAFPSEYWLGEMSDNEFQHWLDSEGNRPKEPVRKPGGFRTKPAAVAA